MYVRESRGNAEVGRKVIGLVPKCCSGRASIFVALRHPTRGTVTAGILTAHVMRLVEDLASIVACELGFVGRTRRKQDDA